jgi:hypothetical protein
VELVLYVIFMLGGVTVRTSVCKMTDMGGWRLFLGRGRYFVSPTALNEQK